MPLDSRSARPPRSVPEPAPEPTLAADGLPPIDPQLLAELRRQIADIDAGREPLGMPWEEARRLMFAPPTPEEVAEFEAYESKRARR